MKVKTILNDLLLEVTPAMHKSRRNCLQDVVLSLINGAYLTVTSLGRNILSNTTEKHQIKRSTRLLSNPHIQYELPEVYEKLALRLVGTQQQPIILVDWSDLDPRKQNFLLRAAVAIDGRSLTLFEEVHPLFKKEKPAVHNQFMNRLKALLPMTCRPIIITDAGFRVPWFKLVESLGWDYVGRVRNKTFCKNNVDTDWHAVKDLYQYARSKPKNVGCYQMSRREPIDCYMVVYRKKKKGRKDLIATGERSRSSKHSRSNASREKEPWLLATSLHSKTVKQAAKIVKFYRSRMQIEESFRDLKTGLNLNLSNTRDIKRLRVLLLIANIAQFILFIIGVATNLLGRHVRYQASSIKDRRVLSFQFVGLRAIKDRSFKLRKKDYESALVHMMELMREQHHV